MYLIYYNKKKAKEIAAEINKKEGVPKSRCNTKTLASVTAHPNKDKYAIQVRHLLHRAYIEDLFAQERIEELTDDWFEENE